MADLLKPHLSGIIRFLRPPATTGIPVNEQKIFISSYPQELIHEDEEFLFVAEIIPKFKSRRIYI